MHITRFDARITHPYVAKAAVLRAEAMRGAFGKLARAINPLAATVASVVVAVVVLT